MGWNQPKESEGSRQEGEGSPHNHNDLKDRVVAKFESRTTNVVNPKATGTGSKGNPGIPT
jgi:hypothetical protein